MVESNGIRLQIAKIGLKATAISLGSFLPAFTAVRHILPNGIILYQGIFVAICISSAQFLWERRRGIYWAEAVKDALLTFLLAYSFVFTIPTTVDRAYTVKLLIAMGQSSDGLTREQINNLFVHGLILEGGVEKRLIEQTSTGSIRFQGGRYSLTPLGRLLNTSFLTAQRVFECRGNGGDSQSSATQKDRRTVLQRKQ